MQSSRVDFVEYMNEEDDFQRIMGSNDDDDFSISNDDDDWEFSYIDAAAGYGLNPYDYADKEEFFEALEWGTLRTGSVGISGTDYIPPIPDKEKVITELESILNADTTATDKALSVFTWGARSQLFWDGNKRTSLVAANKILINAGAGMLTIKENNMQQFNELLVDFYNTGNPDKVKEFLYNNAIEGITV
ncbi:MAG: death-on-curing protein [Acutalibacteraceae bacterium]|nr:death-on-curing protein [Acutalibacteraceae bacterium]